MTSTVFCRRLLCLVWMTTPVVQKYDGTREENGEVEITQHHLVTALLINGLIVHHTGVGVRGCFKFTHVNSGRVEVWWYGRMVFRLSLRGATNGSGPEESREAI